MLTPKRIICKLFMYEKYVSNFIRRSPINIIIPIVKSKIYCDIRVSIKQLLALFEAG